MPWRWNPGGLLSSELASRWHACRTHHCMPDAKKIRVQHTPKVHDAISRCSQDQSDSDSVQEIRTNRYHLKWSPGFDRQRWWRWLHSPDKTGTNLAWSRHGTPKRHLGDAGSNHKSSSSSSPASLAVHALSHHYGFHLVHACGGKATSHQLLPPLFPPSYPTKPLRLCLQSSGSRTTSPPLYRCKDMHLRASHDRPM